MTRDDPPLRIRLPEELKARVQALAAENHRSMNAEIVARLEWSLEAGEKHPSGGTKWLGMAKELAAPDYDKRLAALETAVLGLVTDDRIDNLVREVAALKGVK